MMFEKNRCDLLKLSDEVLLMILKSLSTADIISASRTCRRLKRLGLDKLLMIKIVDPQDDYETMKLIFRRCLNPSTTVLSLLSQNYPNRGNRSSLCPSLLLGINPRYSYLYPERTPRALTHLHIVRQSLDGKLFKKITMFPNTLKVLELTGTHISDVFEETQWFKGMAEHFTKLEELILKFCSWVTTHALLAISKCPELLALNLEGCRNVGDSIPYFAMSTRNGFLKLKILNLNNTDIRDTDTESLYIMSTIEELYIGKYHPVEDCKRISASTVLYCSRRCQNLRVLDFSGSVLGNNFNMIHVLLRTVALKCSKLEKLIAYFVDPLPAQILEEFRRRDPAIEVYRGDPLNEAYH